MALGALPLPQRRVNLLAVLAVVARLEPTAIPPFSHHSAVQEAEHVWHVGRDDDKLARSVPPLDVDARLARRHGHRPFKDHVELPALVAVAAAQGAGLRDEHIESKPADQ